MTSPILWQSKDKHITLIDVPRSIAAAQGTPDAPCDDSLLSCQPIEVPYPSNEPKSDKARDRLKTNTVEEALHAEYRNLLEDALNTAKEHHSGQWCLPRPHIAAATPKESSAKRKAQGSDALGLNDDLQELPPRFLADLVDSDKYETIRKAVQITEILGTILSSTTAYDRLHWLYTATPLPIALRVAATDKPRYFRAPPGSTVCLGDCTKTIREMHDSAKQNAWDHDPKGQFDFFLLDPPWPNRSVKRTHKTPGSSYSTLSTLADVEDLLTNMGLDMLMSDDCLVGLWITNKPAVRELILGEDGIFDRWALELVEEWIWLKITTSGEAVTPLDSLWRKPYEVLLLGRKQRYAATTSDSPSPGPTRRVLMSVPDLHSRKPCLKALIEPMMPRAQYRALEIFARHLVAGWWSWGNECVKFNWNGYWTENAWWSRAIEKLQQG